MGPLTSQWAPAGKASSPEPQQSTGSARPVGLGSSVNISSGLGAPVQGLALAPEGALEAATSQHHIDIPHPTWGMQGQLTSAQICGMICGITGASPEEGLSRSSPPGPEQASA